MSMYYIDFKNWLKAIYFTLNPKAGKAYNDAILKRKDTAVQLQFALDVEHYNRFGWWSEHNDFSHAADYAGKKPNYRARIDF